VHGETRSVIPESLKRDVISECKKASKQHLISDKAKDYLEGWVNQCLPKNPRPATYRYMDYNWHMLDRDGGRTMVPYDGLSSSVNRMRIRHRNVKVAPGPEGPPEEAVEERFVVARPVG